RQMTTIMADNVFNLAVDGTFDDCQNAVKSMFADEAFRDSARLSAVNSINWARITSQIVYYAAAALRLGSTERPVSFAVPTGNFGNVLAAYAGKQMGLPIGELVVGCNRNDILHRFFNSGSMDQQTVSPTIAPSMDIQISSNFERYLFELLDRDGARLDELMAQFRQTGAIKLGDNAMARARQDFSSHRFDDDEIRATIKTILGETGMLVDTHTAIGIGAAKAELSARQIEGPLVALACAHPAKFPDAVQEASGIRPELPPHLADLLDRKERSYEMSADIDEMKRFITGHARILSRAA
ncbi:MAG: threonine synthase, partial [Pseudomonadota bacterium]